jgi:hypothetical protein
MNELKYTPDADFKVHAEGAIRLICKAFQSHEAGLPEWIKNSADAYARQDAEEDKRVIVIILDSGRRSEPNSISCLDFAGMTSAIIENDFRVWADPDAARRRPVSRGIQGGHGNGGKCYMTQMFQDFAMLTTVKQGKGNRYGVEAGSIRFGYIPDRQAGRDFKVENVLEQLERLLAPLRCSIKKLPPAVARAFSLADGFTLATGVGPKGWEKRIPARQLVDNLKLHPQMIQTLELCSVFVFVNGEQFEEGCPLKLPVIAPIAGAELPRMVQIPSKLKDPVSEETVSTTEAEKLAPGTLTLRTSEVSMRWGKKGRHNIIYKGQSGYIGFVPVSELDIQSPYRDRIYGECTLQSLEQYKKNERARLSDCPLTRAVEAFISESIQQYAKEFEARDRRRYDQDEKNAISKMNEALDKWKNRFLTEFMRGLWGTGGGGDPPPAPPLPSGKPARLELNLTHEFAGVGVSFRPALRFFDGLGRRIRPVPFKWISDDNNVAMVDDDLMIINTFTHGQTSIYAQTLDRKILSNKVPLKVVRVQKIRISPNEIEVAVGSRSKLEAICLLANNEETSNVYLVWSEDNANIARVSASGLIFGFAEGQTKVTAGDDSCEADNPAVVRVVPGHGRGRGENKGRGYPLVLVSGEIDPDPETQEYVNFSREDPPVWQRPQDVDRNIWWINSAAPLATMYLDASRDYGSQSREWRMYHLERYIDVIVQIALTNAPTERESLSVNEWIMRWGSQVVEIQAAAVSDLSQFIATGDLPPG